MLFLTYDYPVHEFKSHILLRKNEKMNININESEIKINTKAAAYNIITYTVFIQQRTITTKRKFKRFDTICHDQ